MNKQWPATGALFRYAADTYAVTANNIADDAVYCQILNGTRPIQLIGRKYVLKKIALYNEHQKEQEQTMIQWPPVGAKFHYANATYKATNARTASSVWCECTSDDGQARRLINREYILKQIALYNQEQPMYNLTFLEATDLLLQGKTVQSNEGINFKLVGNQLFMGYAESTDSDTHALEWFVYRELRFKTIENLVGWEQALAHLETGGTARRQEWASCYIKQTKYVGVALYYHNDTICDTRLQVEDYRATDWILL